MPHEFAGDDFQHARKPQPLHLQRVGIPEAGGGRSCNEDHEQAENDDRLARHCGFSVAGQLHCKLPTEAGYNSAMATNLMPSSSVETFDTAILTRAISPVRSTLPRGVAEEILQWDFPPEDK